jgi:hypothetical protein
MRKELLKGFAMLMAVMAFAMVTAVASANGQALPTRTNVPFDFIVGDRNLPAGAYTVSSITNSGAALRIVGRDNAKDSAVRLTVPAGGAAKHAMLVFHRYGERYFLAEVWGSAEDGRQLIRSKQERAIQKELSLIASTKSGQCGGCETVEIAVASR